MPFPALTLLPLLTLVPARTLETATKRPHGDFETNLKRGTLIGGRSQGKAQSNEGYNLSP